MVWKPRRKIWDWRGCLTAGEAQFIASSDLAKREIAKLQAAYRKKFQRERMIVVNRAVQRAKYEGREIVAEMEGQGNGQN